MIERCARRSLHAFVGTAAALFVLWLLEIAGLAKLHAPARWLTGLAALALASTLACSAAALWKSPRSPRRTRSLVLAGILLLCFAVRFVGLDFELMDEPVGDEGVFHEVSQRINRGEPIPDTFNYGHFLYYAGAFALWFYDLFPGFITWLLEIFYTTIEGYGVQRLLLHGVNALLSTLVAGAVFGAAGRIAGGTRGFDDPGDERSHAFTAACLSSLLIVFSPLYSGIARQLIADVPAAAFAAFSLYFVSRLLTRERLADYLLAGAAAGLAAASKYPGGVVAIAIFAVWLSWRIRRRSWSWDLVWAALISIGAMVAAMPGLLLSPEAAFRGGGYDVFFGFRQYARGGWLGVQPESNLVWYGRELASSFGWGALVLGVIGLPLLGRSERSRWLLMAVFPTTYLVLIFSMSMVVHRNLQVVMPALAILIGTSVSAVARRLKDNRSLAVAVVVLALAVPVWKTSAWTVSQTRPGTRQVARDWIDEHVPEGASIIRERYAAKPSEERYRVLSRRFAAWVEPEEMESGSWDVLLLARPAYGRFVEARSLRRAHQEEFRNRYLKLLELPRVAEFAPSAFTSGPELSVHLIEPATVTYREHRIFLPDDATFISHPDLRRDGPGKWLQYTLRWQFAVFKDFFRAGSYKVEFGTNPPPKEGYLHVIDRRNREVGTFDLLSPVEIALPRDEKYLFRVFIAPPTRLYGIEISKLDTAP